MKSKGSIRSIFFYNGIKQEVDGGRWDGITVDNINHSYDAGTHTSNIVVNFTDRNGHIHICTFQYNPDFRIDWASEKEVVSIIYRFEGKFPKGQKRRSFAKYLSLIIYGDMESRLEAINLPAGLIVIIAYPISYI